MNEKQLDELLERKKSVSVNFPKNEAEFCNEFLARLNRPPVRSFHVWRYAAGFLIALGIASFFVWPTAKPKQTLVENLFVKVRETVRLFGSDAAVLFFGNELVTGERESTATPTNFVNVKLQAGSKKIDLALACSDSDSIYLDKAEVSGNVVISRCDAYTLVLDVELTVNNRRVRMVIPVIRRSANRYTADIVS